MISLKSLIEAKKMTVGEAIDRWVSKNRRSGCVAATNFLVSRVQGFKPLRITRYTKDGDLYQHVVATNGKIVIDLAPDSDRPSDGPSILKTGKMGG